MLKLLFNPDSGKYEYVNWTNWNPVIYSLSEQDKQDIANIVIQQLGGT